LEPVLTESLRQSQQQLQTVVNSISEGITFSNSQGGFQVFNPRMKELTGYTVEEADRSGDFSRLLYPDPQDHQNALDGVRALMLTPGVHTSETTITTKSGERRTLRVSSQMLGKRDTRMFLTTYEDITTRKQSEHEREELIVELQEALAQVKSLSGLLPICSHCKKIRDDKGYWNQLETYVQARTPAQFSHGICPDCARELYPQVFPST
jgi:PAS domain S-box-containing protein